jgi:predicted Zn finger-like uncharacterized protein
MRIACPNCDAQYEVDDHAIPEAGRDVQCSNCGHAWYQFPAGHAASVAAKDDEAEDPPEDDGIAAPPPPPEPARRPVDEALMAVLRDEAARELAARKAEGVRSLEVQPDLGLAPPPRPVAPPPAPAAAAEPDPERAVTQRAAARRDLLPDIEEINSTLRAGSETRGEGAPAAVAAAQPPAAGFRTGFFSALVVAGLLVALYVMAPRLAAQFPAAAEALESYAGAVDALRRALDGGIQGIAAQLRSLGGG